MVSTAADGRAKSGATLFAACHAASMLYAMLYATL
jgi:hypothetical protein